MSNLIRFATPRKNSRVNLLIGWLAGGSFTLYDGTPPADADEAIGSQVALVSFDPIPDPSGEVANGVFTLAGGTAPGLILASGTPDFARAYDSTGAAIGDFDVGETGSGAAIIVDNINMVEGALVSLLSFSIAEQ